MGEDQDKGSIEVSMRKDKAARQTNSITLPSQCAWETAGAVIYQETLPLTPYH